MSRQLAYYYRKGKAARKAKGKAGKHMKATSHPHIDNQHSSQPSISLRLHRFERKYPIASVQAKLEGSTELRLNNNVQYLARQYGATIRLTTRHLIVEGISLRSPLSKPAPELLLYAEKIADSIAGAMARDNSIQLKWQPSTTIYEIAITDHPEALEASKLAPESYVPLYWNPETQKVEVWTDMSLASGEMESNHAQKLEKLRENAKYIVEGIWSAKEQLALNQSLMDEQVRFFTKHNKLIDDIDRLIKKLNQRRL